ncbi:restriction endonuclease subunit S [Acinetobacter haemolyticus]|uniref:restriction endonuclease subunit S n=1 Tax=Acinetobacter haemolyticus TaxID=29430 RepID=UPI00137264F0|nr:restriction endonuclease subunit S [Acinetobacter haemolyticus]NAS06356.1 restriction endonuclease subunit S [Acinetobacter haemolyticus]
MNEQKIPQGYKQTEVGVIPEDWDCVKLSEIVKQARLPSGIYKDKALYGNGTKIIKLGDVFNFDEFRPDLAQRVLLSEDEKISYRVNIGDIFIALASVKLEGVGKVMLVTNLDEPTSFDHNVALIRPINEVNSKFIFYLLKSNLVRILVGKNATQVGTTFLKASIILGFPLFLPPIKEQTLIATALSDVDALICKLEKLIAKKQAIKTATMQQLLTGKTRLPQFALREDGTRKGYKQSELGEVPEDWEVCNLGEIGQTIIGLTYSPNDVSEFGTLVLRSSNVQNGKLAFDDNVFVNMHLPERVIVKEGDILICVRNGSRQLIGKCALIDKNTAGSAFGAFMSIYRSELNSFIFYQFQSNLIQEQINERMGATINQITNKDMSEFVIAIPKSLQEQTAIATILSDLDSEIQTLEQRLVKTRQIKQGMMQEVLTGKTRLVQPEARGV